ncbi:MAG: tripartite tricarboxylate transporter permease [Burkholderiales bacterium]|nr:tripartite tricarboxylate transporter permease [Burkholderiales bacterium]MDP2399059.1 tripartite tricarboxylate transporter permease [Burkholderiales bacterium]
METLTHILHGFVVATQPINLWYTFLGVFMGTIIGVLPGIGPSAGIALLIPITYGMNPTSALIMMAGIYYGAKYGGSTTAILIRTPGEAASVMTSIDGYEMAKKGRAGAALAVSAIGSFIAGTIGVIGLTLFAVPLTSMALKFGPAEYFTLMLFAMTAVSTLTGKSPAKGIIATILGLMIATIGIDLQSGQARYTMGIPEFQDGVGFVVVVVGLFAMAEVLRGLEGIYRGTSAEAMKIKGKLWLTREEWRRSIGPIWRGGIIGFVIGVLPGAGGTIAAIMSYTTEKRLSKHPEEFGHGAIEGVAGPESANNSDTAGALVPLLTLGIPGGGATAVMLGAFIMYGVQPGPMLFQTRPDLVWGLINSMYIGNVMLVVLNLPLIGLFVRLLYIPQGILYPMIVAISAIGAYAINGSVVDLWLILLFGVIGYIFDKVDIPVAPLVLSLVLGGMMEQSFRQAMTISGGELKIFYGSAITVTLLVMSLISVMLPFIIPRLRAMGSKGDES